VTEDGWLVTKCRERRAVQRPGSEAGRGQKHFVGLREDLPNSGAVYGAAHAQLRAKKKQVIKSTIGSRRLTGAVSLICIFFIGEFQHER
jgi:hypothetical protein